jgi:hypothetical protein
MKKLIDGGREFSDLVGSYLGQKQGKDKGFKRIWEIIQGVFFLALVLSCMASEAVIPITVMIVGCTTIILFVGINMFVDIHRMRQSERRKKLQNRIDTWKSLTW